MDGVCALGTVQEDQQQSADPRNGLLQAGVHLFPADVAATFASSGTFEEAGDALRVPVADVADGGLYRHRAKVQASGHAVDHRVDVGRRVREDDDVRALPDHREQCGRLLASGLDLIGVGVHGVPLG